jgi:WD40 repeat protein
MQIRNLCLSPDGSLLLAIDEDGRSLLINKRRRVLLHHFSFKGPVAAARFSPDGQYIACGVGRVLQARRTPTRPGSLKFHLATSSQAQNEYVYRQWQCKRRGAQNVVTACLVT